MIFPAFRRATRGKILPAPAYCRTTGGKIPPAPAYCRTTRGKIPPAPTCCRTTRGKIPPAPTCCRPTRGKIPPAPMCCRPTRNSPPLLSASLFAHRARLMSASKIEKADTDACPFLFWLLFMPYYNAFPFVLTAAVVRVVHQTGVSYVFL